MLEMKFVWRNFNSSGQGIRKQPIILHYSTEVETNSSARKIKDKKNERIRYSVARHEFHVA